jgi:hypothetical protein
MNHISPQLSQPFLLVKDLEAELIHGSTHRREPGHVIPAGKEIILEIRKDIENDRRTYGLGPSTWEIVQLDGYRYWVSKGQLKDSVASRSEGSR